MGNLTYMSSEEPTKKIIIIRRLNEISGEKNGQLVSHTTTMPTTPKIVITGSILFTITIALIKRDRFPQIHLAIVSFCFVLYPLILTSSLLLLLCSFSHFLCNCISRSLLGFCHYLSKHIANQAATNPAHTPLIEYSIEVISAENAFVIAAMFIVDGT